MRAVHNEVAALPTDVRRLLPAVDPLDPARWPEGGDVAPRETVDERRAPAAGPVRLVILGEPASKANSRKLATVGAKDNRRSIFIKSDKARGYERDALRQIPAHCRVRLEGPLRVTLRIFYASERPDLDESVVLDVLQDRYRKNSRGEREVQVPGVYRNDRQVREKHVFHGIDRANPRAEILIEPLQAQQQELVP